MSRSCPTAERARTKRGSSSRICYRCCKTKEMASYLPFARRQLSNVVQPTASVCMRNLHHRTCYRMKKRRMRSHLNTFLWRSPHLQFIFSGKAVVRDLQLESACCNNQKSDSASSSDLPSAEHESPLASQCIFSLDDLNAAHLFFSSPAKANPSISLFKICNQTRSTQADLVFFLCKKYGSSASYPLTDLDLFSLQLVQNRTTTSPTLSFHHRHHFWDLPRLEFLPGSDSAASSLKLLRTDPRRDQRVDPRKENNLCLEFCFVLLWRR